MDHGHIMELDSTSIVNRVLMKGNEHGSSGGSSSSASSSQVRAIFSRRPAFLSLTCVSCPVLSCLVLSCLALQPQSMGDITLAQALGLASNSFFKSFTGGGRSEY